MLEVGVSADNKSDSIRYERNSIRFTGSDIVGKGQAGVEQLLILNFQLSKKTEFSCRKMLIK